MSVGWRGIADIDDGLVKDGSLRAGFAFSFAINGIALLRRGAS